MPCRRRWRIPIRSGATAFTASPTNMWRGRLRSVWDAPRTRCG
jgi:hypothetical protein